MSFGPALPACYPLWSHEPGHTLWCLSYRRLHSDLTWDGPIEMGACNRLRTQHFHGVSSASPHVYSLQSRYGKVSLYISGFHYHQANVEGYLMQSPSGYI